MKYNQKHKRGMPYPLCNPPQNGRLALFIPSFHLFQFTPIFCISENNFRFPQFLSRNRLPQKLPPCFFFHFKNRPKNTGLCHSCSCFHSVNLSLRPDTQLSFSVCLVSLPSWFPLPPCRVKGNGQLNKQGGTQNEKFAHT